MPDNSRILNANFTPVEVSALVTPNSKKDYTKQKTDDNKYTLYTVKYYHIGSTPDFTKILVCNDTHEVSAFIDVRRIQPEPGFPDSKGWRWFGIQELNPEMIGDFKHVIATNPYESFCNCIWERKGNTYILRDSNGTQTDVFFVPPYSDLIKTNSNATSSFSYKYNTHPSKPTLRIKMLTQQILLNEGAITKREIRRRRFLSLFNLLNPKIK